MNDISLEELKSLIQRFMAQADGQPQAEPPTTQPDPDPEPEPEPEEEQGATVETKESLIEQAGIELRPNPVSLDSDALILSLAIGTWGNWAKVPDGKIRVDADKRRVHTRKKKLDCPEIAEIESLAGKIRTWLYRKTVKGVLRPGLYLANIKQIVEIEDWLRQRRQEFYDLVDQLMTVYGQRVEESKAALGELFDPSDYPSVDEVRNQYYMKWYWMDFAAMKAPESIAQQSKEIFEREQQKAEKRMNIVEQGVTKVLRDEASQIFERLAESLTLETEDGKKKRLYDSTVDTVRGFLEDFVLRNFGNDEELAAYVAKAKRALGNATADDIRKDEALRTKMKEEFDEIASGVARLAAETAELTRGFVFDEI